MPSAPVAVGIFVLRARLMAATKVTTPDDAALAELCRSLAEKAPELDRTGRWPQEQLQLCGEYGVYEWFLEPRWGGQGWDEEQVVRGYLALSAACLTTTFILTQRTGACRRIAGCDNADLKERLLPGLASGELFATVGISHLTTSRRHLARPALTAEATAGGFLLDGSSPWVTGGAAADVLVLAATLVENGSVTDQQLLATVPSKLPGLKVAEPLPLVGVSASSTGPVLLEGVQIERDWLIAGPQRDVMSSGVGAGTGGYETSTLALGVARASLNLLGDEARRRPDLQAPHAALRCEHQSLEEDLISVARGDASCSKESIRQRANSLVLRASQAALAAAKGSGYVIGHPAGRWCREALFFLVWSCPQPVATANLCELAGIAD
jgi:alkylation response protein AidB-like acyl-CoA dehydrogenase